MVSAKGRKETGEAGSAPEQQGKIEGGAEAVLKNTVRQWAGQLLDFFSDERNRPFLDRSNRRVLVTRNGQRVSEPLTFASGQELVGELGALAEGCEDREKLLEIKRTFLSLRTATSRLAARNATESAGQTDAPADVAPEQRPAEPGLAAVSDREEALSQGQSSETPSPPEEEPVGEEEGKRNKGKKSNRRAERRLKERERAAAVAGVSGTEQDGRNAAEPVEPAAREGGEPAGEAAPKANGAAIEKGTSPARVQGEAWAKDERNAVPVAKLREALALWNEPGKGAAAVESFWERTNFVFERLKSADHRVVPFVLLVGGLPKGQGGDFIEALRRGERRRGKEGAREAAEVEISGPLTFEASEAAIEEADRRFPGWGIRARVADKKTEAGKVEIGAYWFVALAYITEGRNISDPQVDKEIRKRAGRLTEDYFRQKREAKRATGKATEEPAPAGTEPEPAAAAPTSVALPPPEPPSAERPPEPVGTQPQGRYRWQSQRQRASAPPHAPGPVEPEAAIAPPVAPATEVEPLAPSEPQAPEPASGAEAPPAPLPAEARPATAPAAPREEGAPEISETKALEIRWENVGRRLADFRTLFFDSARLAASVRAELKRSLGARISELDRLYFAIPINATGQPDVQRGKPILDALEVHLPPLEAEARKKSLIF